MSKKVEHLSNPVSLRLSRKTEKKVYENAAKAFMPMSTYLRFCIEKLEKEFGLPKFDKELNSRG